MYVCMYVLVWAAKTYSVPVQMAVADFCGQKGLIVSIDDSGTLSIHFLGKKSVNMAAFNNHQMHSLSHTYIHVALCGCPGTKPPVQSMIAPIRELNYDKIDEEHRALLLIIRGTHSIHTYIHTYIHYILTNYLHTLESQNENKSENTERLVIRSQMPKSLDLEAINDVDLPSNLAPL